ncbi:hypothetical protein BN948_01768 [Hydrogenophaga intermedia]|uniref:Transmembrane protein n=1 Tax=Hydrogenophaga intermedia TaxID=65786 RepID=A0A1L1PMT4_HYDIT|nr:hypothetical protein [Hydrogenophaga intermedia]CDN87346.1 hypothetical protein BN948_01768 [Hydrogenophaga intermedia]
MKLLDRIDAAVLGWHQDVVDFLQRRPVVLGRFCLTATALLHFACWFLKTPPLWLVALSLLGLLVMSGLVATEGMYAVFGRIAAARYVQLVAGMLHLVASPFGEPELVRGLVVLDWMASTAYFYFMACRPPRPRPPRRAASLARGAA